MVRGLCRRASTVDGRQWPALAWFAASKYILWAVRSKPVLPRDAAMARSSSISLAALLAAAACCVGVISQAQSSPAVQPQAPSQICVNSQCTSSVPSSPPVQSSHAIKWNPGHYMASNSVLFAGDTISKVQSEMDDLNNQDAILGYRMFITWGALEPTQGNYDFSAVDAILARLKTAYNKPKRLVIELWLYGQGALKGGSGS